MTRSYSVEEVIRYTDPDGTEHRVAGPSYSRGDFTQLDVGRSQSVAASTAATLWDPTVWTGFPFSGFDLLEIWFESSLVATVLLELTCNEGSGQEQLFLFALKSGAKFRLGSNISAYNIVAAGDAFTVYGITPDVIDKIRVKNLDATNAVTVYVTMGKA